MTQSFIQGIKDNDQESLYALGEKRFVQSVLSKHQESSIKFEKNAYDSKSYVFDYLIT